MSLLRETSPGPYGAPADTVACYSRRGDTGVTFTNFNTDGVGIAIGVRHMENNDTLVAILTPEDTEELRQQLNAWFGRKANLVEVKNG